jgi:pimeloyl-ACP methyl ester carboxylesterase
MMFLIWFCLIATVSCCRIKTIMSSDAGMFRKLLSACIRPSQTFKSNPSIQPENALLVLPGLGGSRLVDGDKDIWPPNLHTYMTDNCRWRDNIMTNHNLTVLEFGDSMALDIDYVLPFFGNYMKDVMKIKRSHAIPYDFRRIGDKTYISEFYQRLETYIESLDHPLTLLGHSTGGLLIHWFLFNKSPSWKSMHIKKVIYVSVPFGGAVEVLRNAIKLSYLKRFVEPDILSSISGFIINLPNVRTLSPIMTVNGVIDNDYFSFLNMSIMEDLYKKNSDMLNSFYCGNGVKNTCVVYSDDNPTPTTLRIVSNCVNSFNVAISYGKGDGIVPIKSLAIPETWNQEGVKTYIIHGTEHSSILQCKEFKQFLMDDGGDDSVINTI